MTKRLPWLAWPGCLAILAILALAPGARAAKSLEVNSGDGGVQPSNYTLNLTGVTGLTLQAWCRVNVRAWLDKGIVCLDNGPGEAVPNPDFGMKVGSSGQIIADYAFGTKTMDVNWNSGGTYIPPTGEWHQYTMTLAFDAGGQRQATLYRDGVQTNQVTGADGPIAAMTHNLGVYFGQSSAATASDIQVADVRVWKKCLTAAEVNGAAGVGNWNRLLTTTERASTDLWAEYLFDDNNDATILPDHGTATTQSGTASGTYAWNADVPAHMALAPAAADHLVVTTPPAGAVAGAAFTTQPVVTVLDQYGATYTAGSYTITATIQTGTGTLANATATTTAGVATFSGLAASTAQSGLVIRFTSGTALAASSTVDASPLTVAAAGPPPSAYVVIFGG